jgi:hypothetical protein
VSRWGFLIDDLLAGIATEHPEADGFRISIDRRVRDAEDIAESAEAKSWDETPAQRRQEFLTELLTVLQVRRNKAVASDASNKSCQEALKLLTTPGIRIPRNKRPQ